MSELKWYKQRNGRGSLNKYLARRLDIDMTCVPAVTDTEQDPINT